MKNQEAIFTTFSKEEGNPYNMISVWRDVFIKVNGEWRDDILSIRLSGENGETIEVFMEESEVERLIIALEASRSAPEPEAEGRGARNPELDKISGEA